MVEMPKACTVTFVKARNYLALQFREKSVNKKKKENGENIFF